MGAIHDLVHQHVTRPPVLDGGRGVPVACDGVIELVDQDHDVLPRQFPSSLLGNWIRSRPCDSECPHVLQVRGREALHLGFRTEIVRQTPDHPTPPAGLSLLVENLVPEIPIQLYQLSVDHPLGPDLRVPDPNLQSIKELDVSIW